MVLALLAAGLTALAGFWTEVLWYESVDFSGVFRTQIVAKLLLDLVIDGESYRARQKPALSRSSKTGSRRAA